MTPQLLYLIVFIEGFCSLGAEIIALRWGGRGERLGERGGPIHHPGD